MNRIDKKFLELKKKEKNGFIAYITAGDPTLAITKKLILSLEKSGVDIVELGIPFSDPLADGKINQAAAQRALKNNVSLSEIIGMVKEIRKKTQVPIVFFSYFNPIYRLGFKNFCKKAKEAGVDGTLAVDLPPEEFNEYKRLMDKNNIKTIYLTAPTSTKKRIKLISGYSTGFVYCVSRTGVTGKGKMVKREVAALVKQVKKHSSLPTAVGFSISTPSQAKSIAKIADAVVVGSAIVKVIEKNVKNSRKLIDEVTKFTKSLVKAVKSNN
jgi:tryptophan synthase alpha chain